MKYALLLILLLLSPLAALAQSAEQSIIEGNDAYSKGLLAKAEHDYKFAISKGLDNGHVYYNLANTQYKLGKLGHAIANYLKAKESLPRNSDIKSNLDLARTKVKNKIQYKSTLQFDFIEPLLSIHKTLSPFEVTIVLLALNTICWIFFGLHALTESTPFKSLFSLFLFSTVCWAGLWFMHLSEDKVNAVVSGQEVTFFAGDSTNHQRVFVLHEGAEIHVENKSEDWVQVILPNGRVGWTQKDQIILLK